MLRNWRSKLPSSSESSAAIDFVTAFGRLLCDGGLRDAFAADPIAVVAQIRLRESDCAMFLQLRPSDLEFQARILLRKRFVLVRQALPRTCQNLGDDAWPEFQRYGRPGGPTGKEMITEDAVGFCQHLRQIRPAALCAVETNRFRFAQRRRAFAFHFVMAMGSRGSRRPAVQVFLRRQPGRWHEWLVYLGG